MPLVDDDMSVFFCPDFTTSWTRLAGVDDSGASYGAATFAAIQGVQDVEALQGYALSADTEITYPADAVTLKSGQLLTQAGSATVWRVRRDPQRSGDGATTTALIGLAPAA